METMKIIVNWIARSWTSMVMLMLKAWWVPIYYDSKEVWDVCNPNWYFEHSNVFKKPRPWSEWRHEVEWKAVKMCWLDAVKWFPQNKDDTKVIYIERDPKEVSMSHEKFKEINGILPSRSIANIKKEQAESKEYLFIRFPTLYLKYDQLLKDPMLWCKRIQYFLWLDLDLNSMASVIDLKLYRNRCNEIKTE